MAKCIKNKTTDHIVRVSDEEAAKLTGTGEYTYVSKADWKHYVRELEEV